jgi:nicotinamidase-related amidase
MRRQASRPPTVVAVPAPARTLLSPGDHVLMLVDQQPQLALAMQSADVLALRNNTALVTHAASVFGIDVIQTTMDAALYGAPCYEISDVLGVRDVVERTTMNAWEEPRIVERVGQSGKGRIVFAGLWTSVCVAAPVLSALDQGFEVYVIADACADVTGAAHECALQRMLQAGARPLTALGYLLELQRDWSRMATSEATRNLIKDLGGACGLGLLYATTRGERTRAAPPRR